MDLFSGRVEYKNFEKVVLTSKNDTVDIRDSAETRLMTIDLGDGDDKLLNAGQGSVIITGGGKDDIRFANNIGIADLSGRRPPHDRRHHRVSWRAPLQDLRKPVGHVLWRAVQVRHQQGR